MRKYLVATAIGAMLLAGQAAASDSAVVSVGDRVGGDSAAANQLVGTGGIFIGLSAALLIGLVAWGFSEGHGQTISASP
ncbi:MAG TPA: hypothetical protein VMT68_02295 [Caulobacteraceae bacterium]|nr:hypothetical protein [Caulobacteraceae bacterium]